MLRVTHITLDEHFEKFIAEQLKNGHYRSVSEVVQAGLRLLEDSEVRLDHVREKLTEGERSGFTEYSRDALIEELDNENS